MIETDRLVLRPFCAEDAADVFEYLKEPMVNCFACMKLNSIEEAQAEMQKRAEDTEFYFAIVLKETGLEALVKDADLVIGCVLIPGAKAPKLVTEEMVKTMKPGSVIVDIAIDQGGNCSITTPGVRDIKHGVILEGIKNIPGMLAESSTFMYAANMYNLVKYLTKDGYLNLDESDDIVSGMLTTKDGKVVTPKSDTILPSITRRSLMIVAKEYLGLEVEERERQRLAKEQERLRLEAEERARIAEAARMAEEFAYAVKAAGMFGASASETAESRRQRHRTNARTEYAR